MEQLAGERNMPNTGDARSVNQDACCKISQFLGLESRLLDENRLSEWLAILDDEIIYEVPMRIVDDREGKNEFPPNSFRMRDDMAMLRKRVERTTTGEAWAETPPSRTVRVVGSIAVDTTDRQNIYLVHSAVLTYRQRALEHGFDLIPARRRDLIRIHDGSCKLLRRTIILAEAVLQTPNLGIFL
jgi:3-phenylpropionate/cinnamic acid dioxygenase small subunit